MAGTESWREIHEQAQAWRDALDRGVPPVPLPDEGGELLFTGSGIAYFLAEALSRVAERATGVPARALPAQEFFAAAADLAVRPRTTVVVSRTGDVTDAIRGVEALRASGVAGRLVALIGESGGPLVRAVDEALECGVEERSVTTTKTLTTILLAVTAALFAVGGRRAGSEDFARIPSYLASVIRSLDEVAERQARQGFRQLVILGTGARYGVTRAAALTAREMALLQTHGHHTLVFPHGHKVTLDEDSLCVFLMSTRDRGDELAVVAEARRMGARAVLVGTELEGHAQDADEVVSFGPALDDDATLPLMMVLPQLIGWHVAKERGLDPDAPRELAKVF